MASKEPPLDEQQFRDPGAIMEMGAIHENNILFYFARSPYFDQTSNNAILYTQAMYNERLLPIIGTRQAFEGRLRTMAGLEFIIAQEPAEMTPGAGTGVWVIRKQTRRKRPGEEDEIVVHSTYFVVGENIYTAPSVADILGSRMLSITTSLNKFTTSAASLPEFSPALGHVYVQPTDKPKAPDSLAQGIKEATPVPEMQKSKKAYASTQTTSQRDIQLLAETVRIHTRYGEEYMDEAPITGQPGDFHLSTGRKDKDKLAPNVPTRAGPTTSAKPTPPPALKTDVPPAKKTNKGDKSPKTPASAKPKRKKSKVLNSAGGLSPT